MTDIPFSDEYYERLVFIGKYWKISIDDVLKKAINEELKLINELESS